MPLIPVPNAFYWDLYLLSIEKVITTQKDGFINRQEMARILVDNTVSIVCQCINNPQTISD